MLLVNSALAPMAIELCKTRNREYGFSQMAVWRKCTSLVTSCLHVMASRQISCAVAWWVVHKAPTRHAIYVRRCNSRTDAWSVNHLARKRMVCIFKRATDGWVSDFKIWYSSLQTPLFRTNSGMENLPCQFSKSHRTINCRLLFRSQCLFHNKVMAIGNKINIWVKIHHCSDLFESIWEPIAIFSFL